MDKAKSALLKVLYYDNHPVESLVSLLQVVIVPLYWSRSFGDSPLWMVVSLVISGIASMYGAATNKLAWRRTGSILSLIFSACLVISCHRHGCKAEVAAAMLSLMCFWNYIRVSFESSIKFLTYGAGDKK